MFPITRFVRKGKRIPHDNFAGGPLRYDPLHHQGPNFHRIVFPPEEPEKLREEAVKRRLKTHGQLLNSSNPKSTFLFRVFFIKHPPPFGAALVKKEEPYCSRTGTFRRDWKRVPR